MFFRQLNHELWKLFGKRRTCLGFAILLLAQMLIAGLLRLSPTAHHGLVRSLERGGLNPGQYASMLTVATLMAFLLAYSLLPLFVALVGGDLVSKEAEDGTLRMVLARPISRGRLLLLKWLSGVLFSAILVTVLGAGSLLFSGICFPVNGGLFAQLPDQSPSVLAFSDGWRRFGCAHVIMLSKAVTIMSLALMFSCCNLKPATAAILTLSLITLDRILMELPFFHELRTYFLGHYLNCWQLIFLEPVPWWQIG